MLLGVGNDFALQNYKKFQKLQKLSTPEAQIWLVWRKSLTFASGMEDEIYNLLRECCEARKSHAMEYKQFIGTAANILRVDRTEVEEYVVFFIRNKKADTLLFGGKCYLYNL